MKTAYSLPQEDLIYILKKTESLWSEVKGKKIFLTGGTGFFGAWLLESFAFANEQLGLNSTLVALTRDVSAVYRRLPHTQTFQGVKFSPGDIQSFEFPQGNFSHIIHAATSSGSEQFKLTQIDQLETITFGTRRVLEFASRNPSVEKFLFVSSGAVYGEQPVEMSHLSESYRGAPDPLQLKSTYGEAKRLAEHMTCLYAEQHQFEAKIARPFAFVGPYLPFDSVFAIGNFFKNALNQETIEIRGDGTPVRSYLYAADLAVWLWTILFRGGSRQAYNVGSEDVINIGELAHLIGKGTPYTHKLPVKIAQSPVPGALPSRYVPSTQKARHELHLESTYPLLKSIELTLGWHRSRQES